MVKVINIAVFLTWLALLSLLIYREHTGTTLLKPEGLKGAINKATYWYDIYVGPNKIGFANTAIEKVGEEIIIRHEREMKVRKDGKETILFATLKCLCDPSYSIKSFEYASHFKDEKGIKATGQVDHENILFFLESSEKRRTFKTPTKGRDLYLPMTFIPFLVQKNPVPHSVFTLPVLDLNNLSLGDLKVVLEEVKPVKVGTNVLSLYKFRGGNAIWWSNEKGITVKEESPMGFTLYLQVQTFAKDPSDRILFDYTSLPFFKSNEIIQNPENLKKVKVRIKTFSLDPTLYENSLVTLKNDTLTIGKEDVEEIKKRSYRLPYKDGTLDPFRKSDQWVLSDDKNVKGNALNMASIEKNDAFRMARYLNSDLYFSIRTVPMFFLSDAKDIFRSHAGDYLERTVMFASFSRAVGLPTRLMGGLVYRDGYFYFHTWPEVWFDKWIPVDPTLAQFPADVTHIPLKRGTLKEIASILDSLKSIDIKILEAS
jgi:hypothetical protein